MDSAPRGLVETCLYVEDPVGSEAFYRDVLGLRTLFRDHRLVVMSAFPAQTLLLFRRGASLEPISTPGGVIPAADAAGVMHIAFAVDENELDAWENKLTAAGIRIESRVDWTRVPWQGRTRPSGRSLYFRDPDRHLLELATPGVWPGTY